MRKPLAATALALCCAVPALGAVKGPPRAHPKAHSKTPSKIRDVTQSPQLWATVDVCNTAHSPRVIGVRASMPGTGLRDEQMFMRFEVEYQNATEWKLIPGADSGYRSVGSAIYKVRQSGQGFTIKAGTYALRGMVRFQWRRRGHAVLRATRTTTAGHLVKAGADPPGYSAAGCALP